MEATLGAAELALPAGQNKTLARITTARGLICRMQRTTKHLKGFSRKEQGERVLVDVAQAIDNARGLTAPRARAAGTTPGFTPPATPRFIRAGAIRIEQVLVNLLLNALDAVQGRPAAQITVTAQSDGTRTTIHVTDTGAGIDSAVLPRVTEPFFSAKISGEGFGLGLLISQAIVQEFGGQILLTSTLGQGSCVTISQPAAERYKGSA
jgi:two-component system C4-dicarboxylate transport sensor histidine kinase DctB